MSATPTTAQIFSEEHKQWLRHPMTSTLVKILQSHEESLVDKLSSYSLNMEKSDEYIRLLTAQLGTTKTIKKLINETETFASKSTSH